LPLRGAPEAPKQKKKRMEKLDHKHKCISQLPLVHNFSQSGGKRAAKTKYDKMEIQGRRKKKLKQWQSEEKAKAQAKCTRKMDEKQTKLLVEVGKSGSEMRGNAKSSVEKRSLGKA